MNTIKPLMKCGHSANATDSNGDPVCCICIRDINSTIVDKSPVDFSVRTARCCYGNHGIVRSSTNLPFFEHKPNEKMDIYYCGCYGWD